MLALALVPFLTLGPQQEFWSVDPLSSDRGDAMVAAPVGRIVIAGGQDQSAFGFSPIVQITDEATGTQSMGSLSLARSAGAAVAIGTTALFAGGSTSAAVTGVRSTDAVDIYDAATGAWSTATLSAPRYELAGTATGRFAIFGGGEFTLGFAGPAASAAVDIYDSVTGAWTTSSLVRPRASLAATSIGSEAYFAGGRDSIFVHDDVDILDLESGTWRSDRLSEPRWDLAATTVGDVALFAGGRTSGSAPSNIVDLYQPGRGWSKATLSVARAGLVAVTIGTRAYFIGGYGASGTTDVVDIFDYVTRTWSTGPPIPVADRFASAAVSGPRAYVPNGARMSNEIFVLREATQIGVRYCTPSIPNTCGLSATIEAAGQSVATALPYRVDLYAAALPSAVFAYFMASLTPGFVPMPPTAAGPLCLGGSILRIGSSLANTGFHRSIRHSVDVNDVDLVGVATPILAGQTWHFQAWFRDVEAAGGTSSNFSDGVAISFY